MKKTYVIYFRMQGNVQVCHILEKGVTLAIYETLKSTKIKEVNAFEFLEYLYRKPI